MDWEDSALESSVAELQEVSLGTGLGESSGVGTVLGTGLGESPGPGTKLGSGLGLPALVNTGLGTALGTALGDVVGLDTVLGTEFGESPGLGDIDWGGTGLGEPTLLGDRDRGKRYRRCRFLCSVTSFFGRPRNRRSRQCLR